MKELFNKMVEKELESTEFKDGRYEIRIVKDGRTFLTKGKFDGKITSIERYNKYDGDDKIIQPREYQVKISGISTDGTIKEEK